jgi:hypothetical protein
MLDLKIQNSGLDLLIDHDLSFITFEQFELVMIEKWNIENQAIRRMMQ